MSNRLVVLPFVAVLALSLSALAAAPGFMPVQGFLTDAEGRPVDDEVILTCRVWDDITGGQVVFSEVQAVLVEDGFFTAYLGAQGDPALDLSLFRDHGALYLGLQVGAEAEMQPRLSLGSVPYAGFAQYAGDTQTLGGRPASDYRLGADLLGWDELDGVPDTLLDGDADTLTSLACNPGQTAKWDGLAWACADDVDTDSGGDITEVGAGPGLTGGGAAGGVTLEVAFAGTGAAATAARSDHHHDAAYVNEGQPSSVTSDMIVDGTITGADIDAAEVQARVDAPCSAGSSIRAIDATGAVSCEPDDDTTYAAGEGLTLAGNTFAVDFAGAGTDATAARSDAVPLLREELLALLENYQRAPVGPVYRWTVFSTYAEWIGGGWAFDNRAELFGGVNPSNWTDGNYRAVHLTNNADTLKSLLTRRGYAGPNANVYAETYWQYSSTNGKVVVLMFRIRNSTDAAIDWTPYFYYSAFGSWSEYAGVALNGGEIWHSNGANTGTSNAASVTLTLPANQISTVLFSIPSSGAYSNHDGMHIRFCGLAFYNNSLNLPAGLSYVDDLDRLTGALW
ncbi:MAG TPA: hypothetical protein PK668_02535 [Myxococcota bacterium]|nr:hypothetical protein [Myxococcota bacterium]HRY94554.1 hypothetical protein [Myxococcota bacterium]HSA20180.1 hypothetical protein [Myxococcota bacterium]